MSRKNYLYVYTFNETSPLKKSPFTLVNDVLINTDRGKVTVACMLDLTKGFDTICYEILIHIMSDYGIRGQLLVRFKSYLLLQSQYNYFKLQNETSNKENSPVGVSLGPILFLLYSM